MEAPRSASNADHTVRPVGPSLRRRRARRPLQAGRQAATVLDGTPLPDVSIYQALFGTVPDGTGPAEGRQKYLKGTGRSLFERLFIDLDDEMLRFEAEGQPRPLAQMVFGAEPGTSNSDTEDHAEILKGGGRSLPGLKAPIPPGSATESNNRTHTPM